MENTKIIFESSNRDSELQCYLNAENEIFIKIYEWEVPEQFNYVVLNRQTAIKLTKILQREISKIESEDFNE